MICKIIFTHQILLEASFLLINNDLEGVYNLSFGQGVEIKSVLKMIYEKLNKKFIFDESSSPEKKIFNLKYK